MKTKTKKPQKQVLNKLNKKLASQLKRVKFLGVENIPPNDRLELLKAKYAKEIQSKEQELATLKAKLRNLVEFAEESESLKEPKAAEDKYAKSGLTEAVSDALGCLWRAGKGTAQGVTAGQIRDYILAHGFPLNADPQNFSVAINVTLNRLAANGRIASLTGAATIFSSGSQIPGRKFYRPRGFGEIAVGMVKKRRIRLLRK